MNFNIYNILIFAGILQGFFFSFSILFNGKYQKASIYFLIFTVLSLSLSNFQYWVYDTKLNDKFPFLSAIYVQFELLIVPFFYLFVRFYIKNIPKRRTIFLCFLPFLLSSLYQLLSYFNCFNNKDIITLNTVIEIASTVYNVLLIILIYYVLSMYRKTNRIYNPKTVIIKTRWINYILTIGLISCLFWIVGNYIFTQNDNIGYSQYYALWLSISFLVYWIAYAGIFQANLVNERERIRRKLNKLNNTLLNSPSEDHSVFTKFESLLINDRLYLDPLLGLDQVAKKLGFSHGYLSQVISKNSEFSFNDYVNKLRVETAKKMLEDSDFDNYTVIAIGLEAGFKTKSTFYAAFKKFTNTTPSGFKKVRNL